MKNLKKLITLFLLVSILLSFGGCGNLFSRDGLSWDGSYYQLTDKDGVVVRIPLGVSLIDLATKKQNTEDKSFWEIIFGLKLQAPATSAPMTAPLGLSKGGAVARGSAVSKSGAMTRLDAEGDVVIEGGLDVLSAKAVFSFGSGEVKHPITGEVLCDPKGNPLVAHEKQVLVLQHTDKYYRAVELGSPDAYYLVMNIIDYMGKPGQPDDTGIIMAAQGDFLVNSTTVSTVRIDGQLYPAPKNMVNYYIEWVEGPTPEKETQKVIETSVDQFGIGIAYYGMYEHISRDVGWGILPVSQRYYLCDSDWNMSLRWEIITNYDESDKELGSLNIDYFDDEKIVTYQNDNDGDGFYEIYRVEVYYPNGQLKEQTDYEGNGKSKSVAYYENGQLKGHYESDSSGEISIDIWTKYDLSGNVDSTSDGIYEIYYYYDEAGNMIAWEKYGTHGGAYGIVESYFAESVAWTEQTYWDDGSLKSETNHNLVKGKSVYFHDESGNCTRWEKYYPNGQMEFWYDYVADKSEHYYNNGQIQSRREGSYEVTYYKDGRLRSEGNKRYSYYDDGTYIVSDNETQYLYDKDGNLLGQCSYN